VKGLPTDRRRQRAASGDVYAAGLRPSSSWSRHRTTVRSLALTVSTTLKGRARRRLGQTAPPNNDLIRVVGVPFVADVVEPTEVRPVTCNHPVALGGGKEATELRLPSQTPLSTLIADLLRHDKEPSRVPVSGMPAVGSAARQWSRARRNSTNDACRSSNRALALSRHPQEMKMGKR
jgi:hypothetical protein